MIIGSQYSDHFEFGQHDIIFAGGPSTNGRDTYIITNPGISNVGDTFRSPNVILENPFDPGINELEVYNYFPDFDGTYTAANDNAGWMEFQTTRRACRAEAQRRRAA